MKSQRIICFLLLLQVKVAFLLMDENNLELKYTNKSIFVAIGITGEGKSSFLNAISGKNKFATSSGGNSETQRVQDIEFDFDNNTFLAIDTPGLDDSFNNEEKIQNLKKLILDYPKLKCLLIIKRYNSFRLSKSLQEAIKVFIDSFPLENFWKHVIIINIFANQKDESFQHYFRKNRLYFINNIKKCHDLRDYMTSK